MTKKYFCDKCGKDVKDFIKENKLSNTDVITEESLIDTYFPKGDKRRGDVLVILADINSKQHQKTNKLAEEELCK